LIVSSQTTSTLRELIVQRGEVTPQQVAFHFGDERFSYGQILSRAKSLAAALAEIGVGQGDRVVLILPNGPDFFYAFYACMLLGAVAVPVFPETAPERNFKIAGLCQASCMIIPPDRSDRDAFTSMGQVQNLPVLFSDAAAQAPLALPRLDRDDLAFLQFTSGSTGDPKGVMLTHANLITNVKQLIAGMSISKDDVFVSWLPVYHDMGLILMTLVPFYLGAKLVLLPTSLASVAAWLKKIQEHQGSFTAAPDFAYRLCLRYIKKLAHLDITSLRVALNAAEPVRASTIRNFEKAFSLENVVIAGYGLAEATVGVCTWYPGKPLREDARGLVSVGPAFSDVELEIVDESGDTMEAGRVGRIAIRSKAATRGYYNNPTATAKLFLDNGFFDSGDLGYLDEEGHLFISGRRKNVIISAGRTIANQEVEETIDALPCVKLSMATGIDKGHSEGEQVYLFAEIRRGASMDEEALEDICREIVCATHEKLGFRPGRVYLVRSGTIPRTYNGKLQHLKLKRDYLCGQLREQGRILFPNY